MEPTSSAPAVINSFGTQNYLITPAALAFKEKPPSDIGNQKWQLILSGNVVTNIVEIDGLNAQMQIQPDPTAAIKSAVSAYSIPEPSNRGYLHYYFQVEQYTFYARLGSIFDKDHGYAEFGINSWQPAPYLQITLPANKNIQTLGNIFQGFLINATIKDKDAELYKVTYQINLLGKIIIVPS